MTHGIRIVSSNVVFVSADMPVRDAVAKMKDSSVSSVLVLDPQDQLVGIVTERDIVQRFTLLDISDKLTRLVGTIMSRPVYTARLNRLPYDIVRLHFEHGVRHFPVTRDERAPTRGNIVGIISVTDVARVYLRQLNDADKPIQVAQGTPLCVMAHADRDFSTYEALFSSLNYAVRRVRGPSEAQGDALILDMDGYGVSELRQALAEARSLAGPVVFATSRRELLEPFKRELAGKRRDIALKPIDLSYCHWSLSNLR